jgi:CheY-like chemotaxis protein
MLVDQMMPEMDGFTLVEELQKDPGLAPSTIMMLTSADRQTDAARCRKLRIASYLVKPVKADELQIAILAALSGAIRDPRSSRPAQGRPEDPTQTAAARGSLRILLAEDNPVNQRVALYILQKAGHSALAVCSGKEAIAALRRETFDLVLMDVQMPEMDGFEATGAIRGEEVRTGRHLPIIAMTAHAMKGDRERCLDAGMDDYVSKPIQAAALLHAIDSISLDTPPALPPETGNVAKDGVFDHQSALDRMNGDEGLLSEVIGLFLGDVPCRMEQIRQAIENQDAKSLQAAAHSLKGSAGCLGGGPAVAAARRLEEIGEQADFSQSAGAFATLEQEIQRLTDAISKLVVQPQP